MKICWDNLEKLKYNNKKDLWYCNHYRLYKYVENCLYCDNEFLARIDSNSKFCDVACFHLSGILIEAVVKSHKGKKLPKSQRIKISESHKVREFTNDRKNQLDSAREKRTEETFKKIGESHKEDKNYRWKGGVTKNNIPLYDTYANKIDWCEKVRRNPDNYDWLQVKCTYCGKWYTSNRESVRRRIHALNGFYKNSNKENRLYCSNGCKKLCPVFNRVIYSSEQDNTKRLSREVQPELRQLVFERDNWTCIKCNSEEYLQCHHIEGILWNPLESADIDMCVTVCKNCHKNIHKIEGCTYNDMKCKGENYNA